MVTISGGQRPAVRVQANPTAMAAYGLSLEDLRLAIVNANVVGIGDLVGDYQVLKIYENKVIIIKDGEPLEVELTNTPR